MGACQHWQALFILRVILKAPDNYLALLRATICYPVSGKVRPV